MCTHIRKEAQTHTSKHPYTGSPTYTQKYTYIYTDSHSHRNIHIDTNIVTHTCRRVCTYTDFKHAALAHRFTHTHIDKHQTHILLFRWAYTVTYPLTHTYLPTHINIDIYTD